MRPTTLKAEFLSECDDTNYLHLGERRKRSPRWSCDERTPVRAAVAGVWAIRPAGRCILPNIQYRIGQQVSYHFIVPFIVPFVELLAMLVRLFVSLMSSSLVC
jgi:hypothetical protein